MLQNVTISMIACMARNRTIGVNNQLPWRLPADLKFFKAMTMGKTILMGRRTYESIGKPLPGRHNIVLTSAGDYHPEGCVIVRSIEEAVQHAQGDELVIIGGAQLYASCMPFADKLFLTIIDEDVEGDAWFPEVKPEKWQEVAREQGVQDEANPYTYAFHTFERK